MKAAQMTAEWADIPGTRGYRASDDGFVANRKGKILRQWRPHGGGVLYVRVRGRDRPVHWLVLTAFTGEPPVKGYYPRWRNGNKLDNRVENLVWSGRPVENMKCLCGHGPEVRNHPEGACTEPACPCKNWRELNEYRSKLKT